MEPQTLVTRLAEIQLEAINSINSLILKKIHKNRTEL